VLRAELSGGIECGISLDFIHAAITQREVKRLILAQLRLYQQSMAAPRDAGLWMLVPKQPAKEAEHQRPSMI
jgi:hypothetical protein